MSRPLGSITLASAAVALFLLMTDQRLVDLDVYRMGGTAVLDGLPLYEQALNGNGLPFTYPPFAALLMTPLAALPAWLVYAGWTTSSVACLAAIVTKALPLLAKRTGPVVGAVALLVLLIAFEPVRRTFTFGQVNLFLCAAVLLDLARPTESKGRGWAVGVAAGIKLTPLFFVAFLLVTRQWNALRNLTISFVTTVALGFLLLPRSSMTYWTETVNDAERIGNPIYVANQSVLGFLSRFALGDDALMPLWFAVSSALALAVLFLARRLWEQDLRVEAVSVCGVAALLVSPISWSHHWVWIVPLALALLQRRPTAVTAAAALVFVVAPIWFVPFADEREYSWGGMQAVAGNAYLLGALVLLAHLAQQSRRSVGQQQR